MKRSTVCTGIFPAFFSMARSYNRAALYGDADPVVKIPK